MLSLSGMYGSYSCLNIRFFCVKISVYFDLISIYGLELIIHMSGLKLFPKPSINLLRRQSIGVKDLFANGNNKGREIQD